MRFCCLLLLLAGISTAQQAFDLEYKPVIAAPIAATGRGPVVLIDEAHYNFHTASGRYQPFAELLRRDGFVVKASAVPFSKEALQDARVLVIANALAERNSRNWSLPTPSAFSDAEIAAVGSWVKGGGSLLLIVDHMPFPGAVDNLARALGVQFSNGFAATDPPKQGPDFFERAAGNLLNHPITSGRNKAEQVDRIATFSGSAFRVDRPVEPLVVLGASWISRMPKVAWEFTPDTPQIPVKGWFQGAVLRSGKGRVAVFGEAAMFTAQLTGPNRAPVGMNAPTAPQNFQFLLNVMHWLTGLF